MADDKRLLPVTPTSTNAPLQQRQQSDYRYNNPYGIDPFTEQNHLREYVNVLLKRWWIILSIVVITTVAAFLYMQRIPSIYESETTLLIQKKAINTLQTKEITINMSDDATYWNTQLKLLQNPQLMREVVIKLGLHNNNDFISDKSNQSLWQTIRGVFKSDKKSETKEASLPVINDSGSVGVAHEKEKFTSEQKARVEAYGDIILGGLSIEPVEATNLVTLRYRHTNPEMAMRVVNGVAQVFIENDIRNETQGDTKTKEEVAKSVADLQLKIKQLEEERLNYLRDKGLPLGDGKEANLRLERLQQISNQLLEAENQLKSFRASYEAAKSAQDIYSIPEVAENKGVQEAQKRIADLEEKRSELLVKYTEEHPAVIAINEQLKKAKEFREKTANDVVGTLKSRYESILKKQQQLQADYNREITVANQQGVDLTRLSTLNQEIETTKQLYNQLLQRRQEMQLTNSGETPSNITVANAARMPGGPIGPQRSRNVVIAFLISLFAGIGLAFLLDYVDDTLKSMDDVSRYVQLPTLALIPHVKEEKRFLRSKNSEEVEGSASTALMRVEDARAPVAEAYRHLRTSLLFSSAGRPPQTILITSGQPMEGKTTTAVNTAISLAQTGANVIIIDCDLRRPRVHTYFGLDNDKGLTHYLSGDPDINQLFQTYEKLPNLKVLASGPASPNPAELLGSKEMKILLDTLKENFTHIIVDTPPILSFTDATILSTQVDGVLIVAHSGRSSRALVRRVKQRLLDVGARVFGVVLNGIKTHSLEYGYGYGYYYGDRYARYYNEEDATVEAGNGSRH
jgi:capsular exopolysaccharide synthesis family protein